MSNRSDERLSTRDYQNAIDVQNACNLSGVVRSFSAVMMRIWSEARATGNNNTDWVNTHPIAVLYSSKITSLTRSEDGPVFGVAYDLCKREAAKCA